MKSKSVLILALVMATVTTLMFINYIKSLNESYTKSQNKVEIVVAKSDISKNQRVTEDMFEKKLVSQDSLTSDTIQDITFVDNKVSLVDMHQGEPLFSYRLCNPSNEESDITRKIRDGYRAVSMDVTFVDSVSNLIKPDDYVDVVYTESTTEQLTGKLNAKSHIADENVKVLAVGKVMTIDDTLQKVEGSSSTSQVSGTPTGSTSASTSSGTDSKSSEYTSVTLELIPEQAVDLINLKAEGNIKFMLRSSVKGSDN